ncbi:conserved hypothetical protein [Hyphomicrobiales bacterium]|jgi:hypothetical protein|nr:conserved hypothetical protein [Hyphomicrobiales bacterium]CAH1702166.1 conserved hypothetical protein [Hyphomicrobiales bacterium]CAI0346370.1 conserved hypothetical protein [Hyphomicrobiales bacterium]
MRLRPTKAAGSFDHHWEGSFELIVHMEADPRTLSFASFNFQSILSRNKARAFYGWAAYLLRHELGLFVVAVAPTGCSFSNKLLALWDEADRILAKRSTWLFWTTTDALLQEPHWSNAQKIAECSHAEVDPRDQERVIEFLTEAGQAPLFDCARRCGLSLDSCDAALKLVSSGVLHFDASKPLSLNSQVRLQPRNAATSVTWLQPPLTLPGPATRAPGW